MISKFEPIQWSIGLFVVLEIYHMLSWGNEYFLAFRSKPLLAIFALVGRFLIILLIALAIKWWKGNRR